MPASDKEIALPGQKRGPVNDSEAEGSDALAEFITTTVLGPAENDELKSWMQWGGAAHSMSTPPAPPNGAAAVRLRPYSTSIKVFKRHLVIAVRADGTIHVSADGILSRACYEDWLSTRSRLPSEPEKTFQRILTSTVSGTDGRQPFAPEEENAVLKQLRIKRVWPAFEDTGLTIGIKGFRRCAAAPTGRVASER